MTPFTKSLVHTLAQPTDEVAQVTALKTLYVADVVHDHGNNQCDHGDDCDCGNDHDHLDQADDTHQATADPFVLPQEQVVATTVLGEGYAFTYDNTPSTASTMMIDIHTDHPIDALLTSITASAVGSEGAMQSGYTSGGNAADSFNIMITYGGDLQGELAQSFMDAADYFSQIILKDVADLSNGLDDIVIDASLIEIDGAGSILGRAGPQYVRSASYLPTEAIMEFDVADAQNFADQGLWDDIVFHEMLHTLGFGTLWGYMDLRDGSIDAGDMRFNGTHANDVYEDEFASIAASDGFDFGIPIETDGGAGTAGGHWDEATFNDEIMTGYVNGSNFMSWMSIAALEDMGYDTIYDNPYDPNDAFGSAPVGDPLALV